MTVAVSIDDNAAAARLATVAGLREKLARLGGLGGAPSAARAGAAAALRAEHRARFVAPPLPAQPGFEAEETPAGTAWVRRVDVDLGPLLDAAGAQTLGAAAGLLRLVSAGGAYGPLAGEPVASCDHGRVAVLDIESLGLRGSGVLAFLVGIGVQQGTTLEVHQVLLADPGDEAALLTAVLDRLEGCAALVTYNGRSFDVPALRARFIVNRLGDRGLEGRPHCDLLGPVRRLFRDRLGACTLRQAEIELLGMERVDDVPGFEAPGRYRAWLRGAGPEALAGVVRHNELDLCATAVLGARLLTHVDGDMVGPVHAADRFRLALHLERRGETVRSEGLLRDTVTAEAGPWDRRAAFRLAARLRRGGGPEGEEEALSLLRSLWREEPADLRGARALAIALERARLLDEAVAVCRRSTRLCEAMPAWRHERMRGAPDGGWPADWRRRGERLEARQRREAKRPRGARVQMQSVLLGA
ncbi:MAG TPA: ribonuclease H-like domain-containing protein [Candidatus Dormibacteraeota bacterium]|jgi:uncharacterized protein YprB with RNaseH-like and TPR domain|nr:ribonuclease H-like domain-containing protein [Candidatus Dormibacteraeota bacterium]